ncbi:Bug family tripartite tricarboxylate transporter substrate binding protein [Bordetella bronchiseptica]|uniref:Bug family tripartite tricarboxylate transporter substrate binding protein n=1 Tax=Bordetella bronchiseptica TaxID=518 RepID=UPI000460B140|nr:tripartite tricarboxylate transporter substrate binding protein [Bordetella bronchiseptica]KDC13396.1 tripartite tricarboxylate transporter family receptor [Bordetella bronchiseptica E014]KDC68572.1 tripartite tricarboxylate transporter family receptor [Bordetella bronchiseptica MBORD591]KDD91859.1 tripartite tricarboxylate transporter family receptor [Bordetella bronchiseptica MO275]
MLSKSLLALIPAALLCHAGPALAQWPERPITWVVPFAAGGPMDVVSRPVAKKMGDILGQAVVVENRTGAGGALGMDYVARARPDGYTVGIGSVGTQTIVPNVSKSVKYDPIESFSNIGLLGRYTNVLLVSEASPIGSVAELVALAQRSGSNVTFGSAGHGSSNHLSAELLRALSKAEMTHVPYRGSAPALTDLLAGNTSFMFDTFNTTMSRIRGGSLRPLAVTSPQRSPFLPDVPTMDEAGVRGYAAAGGELWWGVVGPAGIPPATLERLNAALRAALASSEVQDQLRDQFVEIWSSTPAEFTEVVRASYRNWNRLAREAGIEEGK